MRKLWLILVPLLATACGGGEETPQPAIPEGTCLQLEVAVGEGFKVDGEPKGLDEIGPALAQALEAGNRTAIVDVTCTEGVTMEAIRQLHDVMTAQELYRIQYFHEPDPPIPFVLPNPEMETYLAGLPAGARCVVALGKDGRAMMEGEEFTTDGVAATLSERPEVIFVLAATDDVEYADFARVLGEITGAGAQRISIQLIAG